MTTAGKKSIVTRATKNSKSLRATIPEDIADDMQLEVGDVLDWQVQKENERKVMKVRKLE